MSTIKFIVGKTSTGFDAYYEEDEKIIAVTTGSTIAELKTNALEAYNLYADHIGTKKISLDQIVLEFDVPALFEFYGIINASALSKRIGMNNSLLSHYIKGVKKPSKKQVKKILTGIRDIGKELSELQLV